MIVDLKEKGKTIFLTTHNMFVADELCDRVAFLNNGEIVALDTPKNLKLKYGSYSIKVEYKNNGNREEDIIDLNKSQDKSKLKEIIDNKEIITMHTREATLEEIFIQMTGRGLA
jgi:fluoroquinolone transport system ATP-binding protein